MHNLESKAINFVLAFPQAELNEDIWIKFPAGFQVYGQTEENSDKHYLLKLEISLYGIKQASFNWYEKLKKDLEDRKYIASYIDPCIYLGYGMIVLTYVDDCTIVGNNMKDIYSFVDLLKNVHEKFALTDKGDLEKNLGVKIMQLDRKRTSHGHFSTNQRMNKCLSCCFQR